MDKEKFKKLGLSSLLDLVLLTPYAYENNTLSTTLIEGEEHTFEAKILSTSITPKVFKFTCYVQQIDATLEGVLFHYKPFHLKTFYKGVTLFIKGNVEGGFHGLEMVQPKVVGKTLINQILPKYLKTAANKTVKSLVSKYLSEEALVKEGLPVSVAKSMMAMHFPSSAFVQYFNQHGFDKEYLYALKYTEVYHYFKRLSQIKNDFEAQESLCGDVDTFISSLPFTLTSDQLQAIKDIQNDFRTQKASKRIIMGDVGSGKTMVILASVMLARPYKSILMAPTTLLAKQLFEEAQTFLPKDMKNILVTNKTKKEDLSQYDFIIGTHALLYRELPHAPLVMVDEQHRFGTKQRELIKQLVSYGDKRPHFLQFSATPIPRTFSMLQSKTIDFSFIKELPFEKNIDTVVMGKGEFPALLTHLQKQIDAGHQSIIVYPLVSESEHFDYQSLEEVETFWKSKFEGVYVTHGKDKDKEDVLSTFRDQGNILLATTVIEVGISLPRLSTIVISAPERLGLASLHQLRGRVSRNGLKGYCYLFTKVQKSKRLEDFAKTVNGFEIAELDLKYRQSGDLLTGDFQSGKSFKWVDFSEDEALIAEVSARPL